MLTDLIAAGGHIPLTSYNMNLMYFESTGTYTLSNISSSLTSSDATWCPITHIKILTYDTSLATWTDVSSSDSNFYVVSSVNLFINSVSSRAYTDYYIGGYTAGGSLQDYFKMSLTICGGETLTLSTNAQTEGEFFVLILEKNTTISISESIFDDAADPWFVYYDGGSADESCRSKSYSIL